VAAVKAAAEYQGLDLAKASAAIEGFGAVGSAAAEGLRNLGCRIEAISTNCGGIHSPRGFDVAELLECYRKHGSRMIDFVGETKIIPRESLLELDVDILVPCARHHSIHGANVNAIKAKLISCGANVPATVEAERILWERGILCVPDFVANAGGVLGGTMQFAGFEPAAIAEFVDRVYSKQVSALIGAALRERVYLREKAERIAMQRWERVKRAAEKRSLGNRVFSLGLDLYRNGWIPAALVGKLARKYFQKGIEGGVY
jgi:glutamate dehydrogenase (NAD(P)+)